MASRSEPRCEHGNVKKKCTQCVAQLLAQSTEPSIVYFAPDGSIELIPLEPDELPVSSTQH